MERVNRISQDVPLRQHPFSEAEILELQDKFLSEGIHHIKVADVAAGRDLINTFLDSWTIYRELSCVTLSNMPLESYITNIYHELLLHGHIHRSQSQNLEEFFIDQFYFDFLWIECTSRLTEQPWFADFQMNLFNFRLEQQMPIFMISYDYDENPA